VAAGWWPAVGVAPVLVPVPAHPLRRLERGQDAPLLLARALGRQTHWPVRRLLRRRRYTPPQGEPGSASRSANVRGAFAPRPVVRRWRWRQGAGEPTVVLVDDVVSSGATLSECARVVRSLGVRFVGAVCLARAERARA